MSYHLRPDQQRQVIELLRTGASQRETARKVGCSRVTIQHLIGNAMRCFLSAHSQWTIDDVNLRYLREPRKETFVHPTVPYEKHLGWQPLRRYIIWTEQECLDNPPIHNSLRRAEARSFEAGELYLYVEQPSGYWIDTIVREVFP